MEQYNRKLLQYHKELNKAKTEGGKLPDEPQKPYGPGHRKSPSGLFNGMIAPLIPYAIKGVIWYQGESNVGHKYYRKLFPAMIQSWREKWNQGDFPFLFVQLHNLGEIVDKPPENAFYSWPELRESQLKTLALPNTGMAVAIDVGDVSNIHPRDKKPIGERLAFCALANSYGKKIIYCGPVYKSAKINSRKLIIEFDYIGSGLVAENGGKLKGFAIAGADRKFYWADAEISNNTVVVSSSKVTVPAAVRYAWANNPVCNLYNKEGFPASPFRTDDWLVVEEK